MKQLHKKTQLQVLGIMNGTSLDGIDFVLTQIQKKNSRISVKFKKEIAVSFPEKLRSRLKSAANHQAKVDELALLHHDLGRFYASSFKKIKKSLGKIDVIGLHGQTVFHQAPLATLQIGESSYLSAVSKVPVISDFRVSDLALGGQGAPIATLFHQNVFAGPKTVSVHNLGGISNLSLITKAGVKLAFDTGPANMLMDLCVQKLTRGRKKYDHAGNLAAKGDAHLNLVGDLLKHSYFKQKPPKSCGREEFGEKFLESFLKKAKKLSAADKLATLCEFTAWSIALSYKKYVKHIPEKIIFCGGGAHNKYLLQRIQMLMPETEVQTCEDYNWPASSIEGAAFALLAAHRVWNIPSNLPQTTGASRLTSMGKITSV